MKRYPLNHPIVRPGVLTVTSKLGAARAKRPHRLAFGDGKPHAEQLVALAETIGQSRHRRQEFVSAELFAEPGWEMLLALYRADAAGLRMTVSNLCRMSGGPETTAMRWIDKLEDLGLIVKRGNPLDGRVTFVELLPETKIQIQDYLIETWASMADAISTERNEK